MSDRWERLGLVFRPPPGHPWMTSHAANPIPERTGADEYRVLFNYRDADGRSGVAALRWAFTSNLVVELAAEPVMRAGDVGSFDDRGVSLGSLVRLGSRRYLYYTGWNVLATVRLDGKPAFANTIGLAVSDDGGPFRRWSRGPILGRSDVDPYSMSYPWVEPGRKGLPWRMWYGSNTSWGDGNWDMEHVIKLAYSNNGVHWVPSGHICVDVQGDDAYAFSRPCIVPEGDHLRMWYSQRGTRYTIGTATSTDGVDWNIDTAPEMLAGSQDWENSAVCYSYVFDHEGELYALYCGNGYGETGFGLARRRSSADPT